MLTSERQCWGRSRGNNVEKQGSNKPRGIPEKRTAVGGKERVFLWKGQYRQHQDGEESVTGHYGEMIKKGQFEEKVSCWEK